MNHIIQLNININAILPINKQTIIKKRCVSRKSILRMKINVLINYLSLYVIKIYDDEEVKINHPFKFLKL